MEQVISKEFFLEVLRRNDLDIELPSEHFADQFGTFRIWTLNPKKSGSAMEVIEDITDGVTTYAARFSEV